METWPIVSLSLLGIAMIAVLVFAANLSVKKLVGIAAYFNLSSTFMGMTVVSVATSIPEITSHVTASVNILGGRLDMQTGSAIVLGSNIGSDVVQQTFILGLVVLLTGTMYFRRYFMWKSMLPMIGSAILCIILGWDGVYSRVDGAILFGSFIIYSLYLIWTSASSTMRKITCTCLRKFQRASLKRSGKSGLMRASPYFCWW